MNISNLTRNQRKQIDEFDRRLMFFTNVVRYVYVLLAIIGVLLIAYVLIRLVILACTDKKRFRNGTGLPLAAMCIADLLTMLSIIMEVFIAAFISRNYLPIIARTLHCKISLFVIHGTTGFSTWCWLLVSALRYMAVYHPLWHLSHKRVGFKLLLTIVLFSFTINSWLLWAVVSHLQVHFQAFFQSKLLQTCVEHRLLSSFNLNRILHAVDVSWSFLVPACITLLLDIRVMLTQPPGLVDELRKQQRLVRVHNHKKTAKGAQLQLTSMISNRSTFIVDSEKSKEPLSLIGRLREMLFDDTNNRRYIKHSTTMFFDEKQSTANTLQKTSQSNVNSVSKTAVCRWLTITTIGILLNTPENVLRLISIIHTPTSVITSSTRQLYHLIAIIARLLYFSQYCFIAVYLFAVVYRLCDVRLPTYAVVNRRRRQSFGCYCGCKRNRNRTPRLTTDELRAIRTFRFD